MGLREAARQILDFAGMPAIERPDLVIMGGRLDGELGYRQNPLTITEPCTVRRRTLFGGVKEEAGKHITFLLPEFEQDGMTYHFPDVITTKGVPENPPQELLRQWSSGFSGVAACVLSRIVETYLPEAGGLGVSGDLMFDAALSAEEVDRYSSDAAQQLRGHIQRLTGEA